MFHLLMRLSLVAVVHGAIGPVADMHVINRVISPDGFHRSAVLASSSGTSSSASFPGPVITAKKGDHIRINVINGLKDATMLLGTSIHWHGIFQKNTSWEDGVVGVNQCPIISGNSFVYDFGVPNQAGTFWYHSHYSAQYCDGLRGPIVIYDPHDPHKRLYDVDDESTIITLADWYHDPTPELLKLTAPFNASSILINGKGRYPGGPNSPLSVVTVHPNTRYRFRLVSITCDPTFTFSIDNHIMTIIEVDGVNVVPLDVDSIQIFSGQRYSFILKTNIPRGGPQNFWIRAIPGFVDNTLFYGGLYSAILHYSGAPNEEPRTTNVPISKYPMLETNLHPLENRGAPGGSRPADISLNLAVGFDFDKFIFLINGATFTPPTVPVLLQILSGARDAKDLLPSGAVYTFKPNQIVEITIPGGPIDLGFPHPFHLHGHNFAVIRSAGSKAYNYDNPVVRDVVSSGTDGDNVTIRFMTDNAGPWFMHCHIEWHLELGLAIVFAEDTPTVASEYPPTSWDKLCPIFDAQPPQ